MEGKICISCKKKVVNDKGNVTFLCPNCSQTEIVRCNNCRVNAIKYVCAQCDFNGPN